MPQEVHIVPPEMVMKAATIALVTFALWGAASAIKTFKEFRFVGSGTTATNTITVSGEGEIFAVPDLATFSVTVLEEAKEVKDAQTVATKKSNAIVDYLKAQGIEEKDIKTTSYNVNPKYEWIQETCTANRCPPGKQVMDGFEVSQTVEVKVRDTAQAGDLLSGVGKLGVNSVSGLSFTIDQEDKLNADARAKAIADAEGKAKELANQLGVSLVRIVGFNENSGGYPIYMKREALMSADSGYGSAVPAMAPSVPTGENKITSNVTITYEIR
ncbi:SIMPL domain-containing protein [Candidatus Kaiserbacteria bacterium]|nr:SIMPL domain-containing protein [Candidatus Kaiserbacteria bacterium]